MTPTEIRAIVRMATQACMAGDAAAFASLFASEGELILPGQILRGRDAILQATANYLATLSVIEVEIAETIVEGDRAAVAWTWRATQRATGDRQQSSNAILLEFRRGLIARWHEYAGASSVVSPSR